MKKLLISLFLAFLILSTVIYIINFSIKKNTQETQIQIDEQDYCPVGNWRTSTPEEQGMDSEVLANMIESIRESGKKIDSITIIRNGYLVNETYFYPYPKGLKHILNSCTKSFISALVGMAINEGQIKSVNDKVLDYFPGLNITANDQRKQKLAVKNLLTMSTGLDWKFSNNASTNQMLQSENWTKFVLDQPMLKKPGNTFNYCNGAAQVLSSIIQKSTGKNSADLAAEKLKIGIEDMHWSSSPENVNSGYSGIYLQPDDMAKFGYLYLKKGNWNGQQLIPEKWIKESTRTQIKATWTPIFPGYGYMWWINRFGGYAALGYGGQYIFVVPELEMVVVFTGGLYQGNDLFYPGELMENFIIKSVKSDSPLGYNQKASELLKTAIDAVQNAPLPQPASSLPEIAERISGKTFIMDNSETLTFWFKDRNECTFDSNSKNSFQIGLDNVFRIFDSGNLYGMFDPSNPYEGLPDHNHGAFKGRWLNENTFQINLHALEYGFELVYYAKFEDDRIELKSKTNLSDTEIIQKGVCVVMEQKTAISM